MPKCLNSPQQQLGIWEFEAKVFFLFPVLSGYSLMLEMHLTRDKAFESLIQEILPSSHSLPKAPSTILYVLILVLITLYRQGLWVIFQRSQLPASGRTKKSWLRNAFECMNVTLILRSKWLISEPFLIAAFDRVWARKRLQKQREDQKEEAENNSKLRFLVASANLAYWELSCLSDTGEHLSTCSCAKWKPVATSP